MGRSGKFAFGLGVAIGLIVAGATLFAPWWRPPARSAAEIEGRFREVGRLATSPGGLGRTEVLGGALSQLRASPTFGSDVAPSGASKAQPPPRVHAEELDPHAREAIALLRRWHLDGGGFARTTCDSFCSERDRGAFQCALELMRLGNLTLSVASEPGDGGVDAVLHLAHSMRGAGRHADFLVGTVLAERTTLWALDRGVQPWKSFANFAPNADEVLPAFARDRWCALAPLHAPPRSSFFDLAISPARVTEPVELPFGVVRPARDRLVALDQASTAVLAASARAPDLPAMAGAVETEMLRAAALRRPASDSDTYFAPTIESASRVIALYRNLLRSSR